MNIAEIITLFRWALGLVNLIEPFNGFLFYIAHFIFFTLLIAHVIEIFIYHKLIKEKSKNYVAGLIQTFLFGVIYLNKIKKL